MTILFTSFPDNKILNLFKFKEVAGKNQFVNEENLNFVYQSDEEMVENSKSIETVKTLFSGKCLSSCVKMQ